MKYIILILCISLLAAFSSFSKKKLLPGTFTTNTSCDSTPANCDWNLLNSIFTDIDSANCQGSACGSVVSERHYGISANSTNGFHDVSYSGDKDDQGNACGTGYSCIVDDEALHYFVYFPKHNYTYTCGSTTSKLPAIILFHAGAFSDCSSIEGGEAIKIMARLYAKRGFVAFVVEYRRGALPDVSPLVYTSAQKMLAYYRGIQDGRGTIRNIIYREQNEGTLYNDPYRIDLKKIFIGGMSAGSIIAISTGFYEYQGGANDQLNNIFPGINNSQVLGAINQQYYDCNACTLNYFTNSNVKILGVMGCWGVCSMPVPASFGGDTAAAMASYFANNHNVPAFIGWCGEQDNVAPPYIGYGYFSPASGGHAPFNSENRCLLDPSFTYHLYPDVNGNPDVITAGSIDIYKTLRSIGIPTEVYIDTDMGHGVKDYTTDNFSVSPTATSDADVYKYIVGRSASFFQAVMNGIGTSLGDSYFKDCYNARTNCTTSYHTSCGAN